jgi:hypothetical protein
VDLGGIVVTAPEIAGLWLTTDTCSATAAEPRRLRRSFVVDGDSGGRLLTLEAAVQ